MASAAASLWFRLSFLALPARFPCSVGVNRTVIPSLFMTASDISLPFYNAGGDHFAHRYKLKRTIGGLTDQRLFAKLAFRHVVERIAVFPETRLTDKMAPLFRELTSQSYKSRLSRQCFNFLCRWNRVWHPVGPPQSTTKSLFFSSPIRS